MFSSSISLGLALLPFVSAAVYEVQVGASDELMFSPEAIPAQVGDQVVFSFVSKNHTVTQSSFASPCGPQDGGFDSGFMPVALNQTDNFPTQTITVQNTQPLWFYCRQMTPFSHCGAGMVFAVNCGSDGSPNSFTNFKQAALAFGAAQSSAAAAATAAPSAPAANGGDSSWTTAPSSISSTPDPTPTAAEAAIQTVKVGGPDIFSFNPSNITANVGDVIVFEFQQKNHSVTQSSFATPCHRLDANGTTGFDSGFMPVGDNATTFPTWNYTVTDQTPVWAYCRQTNPNSHCGAGMVFSINAVETSDKNFTAFQDAAIAQNGTAAASNAAPTNAPSSAISLRISGTTATVVFAAALALLL